MPTLSRWSPLRRLPDRAPLRRAAALLCMTVSVSVCCLPVWAANTNDKRTTKAVRAKTVSKADAKADTSPDANADIVTYGRRDDVMRFAAELADARLIDRAWLEAALAQARYQPSVARLIMPPAAGTAKNWAAYRARFVEPRRIQAGLAFWARHQAWLDAAELRHGVPAEIVLAIIGVETFYGQVMGDYRVLDALATLAFDFPSGRKDRSAFFRDELGHFLTWTKREGLAPSRTKGSYAGAIGLGQFMPSSIQTYAVDFDGDGHIDMSGSAADVIGSVANYLAAFGWVRGQPTHFAVQPPVDTSDRAALLLPDILPTFTAEQMAARGALLGNEGRAHVGPLALVELQNGSAAASHVAGTQNFYVVTRYNWSSYYALTVIELAQALKVQRERSR